MTRLLDTSVLVAIMRRREPALRWANRNAARPFAVATVTLVELYRGATMESDRTQIEAAVGSVDLIAADGPIAVRAGDIMRDFERKVGLDMADAIIAATAQIAQLPLLTLNLKHFPMLADARRPF